MKVHIVLRKGTDEAAIQEVVQAGRLSGANLTRAKLFGILTADVPMECLDAVRRMSQVEAVEVDGEKRALG